MAEITAIVFDLDDTLYPEVQYRESALRYISNLLASPSAVKKLLDAFSEDSAYPLSEMVNWLVRQYRSHPPSIQPYPDVIPALQQLQASGFKLGLVTNNATGAQPLKLEALRLDWLFDAIVVADPPELKPSLIPFKKCLALLGVAPAQALMVGDDLFLDLNPALSLGMRGIRMERPGQLKGPFPSQEGVPVVQSLQEVWSSVNRASI